MGDMFDFIGNVLPIVLGGFLIQYFGGFKVPKTDDAKSLESFNELKNDHGSKIVIVGVVLILFGLYSFLKPIILNN